MLDENKYTMIHPLSKEQIRDVANLDQYYFGSMGYNPEELIEMAIRYPDGIFSLLDKATGDLLITISIWPISQDLYTKMRLQDYSEEEIRSQDILTDGNGSYWWIAALLADKELREMNPSLISSFFIKVFMMWAKGNPENQRTHLIASGFTKDGTMLLRNMHFNPAENSSHNVLFLESSIDKIWGILARKVKSALI